MIFITLIWFQRDWIWDFIQFYISSWHSSRIQILLKRFMVHIWIILDHFSGLKLFIYFCNIISINRNLSSQIWQFYLVDQTFSLSFIRKLYLLKFFLWSISGWSIIDFSHYSNTSFLRFYISRFFRYLIKRLINTAWNWAFIKISAFYLWSPLNIPIVIEDYLLSFCDFYMGLFI